MDSNISSSEINFYKIYIAGVPINTKVYQLKEYFSQYGKISKIFFPKDRSQKHSRGFGLITFKDTQVVEKILAENSHMINGRKIQVEKALKKEGLKKKLDNYQKVKIFVSGFSQNLSESELDEYFRKFGPVKRAYILYDTKTNKSRGYGYVEFLDPKTARLALQFKPHMIKGSEVIVDKMQLKRDRELNAGQKIPNQPEKQKNSEKKLNKNKVNNKINKFKNLATFDKDFKDFTSNPDLNSINEKNTLTQKKNLINKNLGHKKFEKEKFSDFDYNKNINNNNMSILNKKYDNNQLLDSLNFEERNNFCNNAEIKNLEQFLKPDKDNLSYEDYTDYKYYEDNLDYKIYQDYDDYKYYGDYKYYEDNDYYQDFNKIIKQKTSPKKLISSFSKIGHNYDRQAKPIIQPSIQFENWSKMQNKKKLLNKKFYIKNILQISNNQNYIKISLLSSNDKKSDKNFVNYQFELKKHYAGVLFVNDLKWAEFLENGSFFEIDLKSIPRADVFFPEVSQNFQVNLDFRDLKPKLNNSLIKN